MCVLPLRRRSHVFVLHSQIHCELAQDIIVLCDN
jgi:hypothetical protein